MEYLLETHHTYQSLRQLGLIKALKKRSHLGCAKFRGALKGNITLADLEGGGGYGGGNAPFQIVKIKE